MNKCIKLTLIKLNASYSVNFKFKVLSQIKNLNNEKVETHDGFKFEKDTNCTEINEQIELNIEDISLINLDSELDFFLQIKTKTGYKTAGIGKINFNDIKNNEVNIIEIKCSLGKGNFEVQIELPKSLLKQFESKNNNLNLPSQVSSNIGTEGNSNISNIILNNQNEVIQKNNNNKSNNNNNNINNGFNNNDNNDDKINKLLKEISELKKENEELKNKTTSHNNSNLINGQLKDKDKIIQELKNKVIYSENEASELKSIVDDLTQEKKKLNEEKNEMIRQQREKINELSDSNNILQNEINQLKSQNINLKSEKDESSNQANQKQKKIQQELEQLKQELTVLKNNNFNLQNDISLRDEKISELEKKNSDNEKKYQKEIEKINLENTNNNNNVINLQNDQIKKLTEEITQLKIDIEEKEENIKNQNEKIEKLQISKSNEENENLSKLMEQISLKDKKIDEYKEQINILKIEKSEIENKISLQNNSINENQSFTEKKLKDDLIKMRNKLNNNEEEIRRLKDDNTSLKLENDRLEKKVENSNLSLQSNEDFLNQLQEMQKTFGEREKKIKEEKNTEINKLKRENEELLNKISKNNSSIDNTKYLQEIQKLNEAKQSIEEDLNYYKELNSKFIDVERKATELEGENAKLKNIIESKSNELNKMQNEFKEIKDNKEIIEKELISTKEKLNF